MSWGLMQPVTAATPSPPQSSPFSRIDRDGGWSGGYKGKSSGSSPNAALSALALISFLFFLNLLQQQLSAGQQQTLLFMVNNTGRRRRDTTAQKTAPAQQPLDLKQDKTTTHEELDDTWVASSPTVPLLPSPSPVPAPPTAGWQEVATWMRGLVPASELPPDLADSLYKCRGVVACSLHHAADQVPGHAPVLAHNVVRDILEAAGELQEAGGGLEAACEELLARARGECGQLASTFSTLLPTLRHDPHDLLHDLL